MAELQVLTPDGATRTVPLADKAVTLGRADDCDLVLAEQKASRKHCRVEPNGGGWRIVDEGSSNGTFLGGKPVLASRLKPGDEIEIGDTVITYVDESGGPAPAREPRKPRVRKKATPWGALFVPVIAAAVAFGLAFQMGKSEGAASTASFNEYAKAEIERASLEKDPAKRSAALRQTRGVLERLRHSDEALRLVDAAIAGPAAPAGGETPAETKPGDDWRAAIAKFDEDKAAPASQRKTALAALLERHVDEADAVGVIRERIRTELTSAGERSRLAREQTFAQADAAAADGRYGDALEKWTHWIQDTPAVSPEDDAAVAARLADLVDKSRTAAQEAATAFDTARKEGRAEAAQSGLAAAIERLHGTGFDVWLSARGGGRVVTRQPGTKPGPDKPDDAAARERAKALQIAASGEALARERQFENAAAKLDEAAAAVSDKGLKGELALRAGDLRVEAAFLPKLLGWVAADPKKFSPLKLDDRLARVAAATPSDISVLDKDGRPEARPVADFPSQGFAQLVEKAGLDKADFVAAALFLRDLGEHDAYTKWMREALAVEEMRPAASDVHARCIGRPNPTGGFMPHPKDPHAIVTYDEYKAIVNEAKIAELKVELVKVVDKVEKSKQAKSVETVRKAYMKLEAARNTALALIFDEVKYFYPYHGRDREYAPVQHEVDELVKAVRDAWDDPTKAAIRTDAALDKLRAEADKLVTEIQFYGGDPSALVERINAVTMYVGHDLNVQTFFENQGDLDRMAYNEKVLKLNPTVKGPTEPEKQQVEITNQYRIMFGHRRALRINVCLVNSARGHSEDMSKLGFFDHFSPVPGKNSPDDRMKLAGYQPAGGSENIYAGGSSPESAHQGWIHSSGHHRNILTPAWVEMGSGLSGNHWTQNFGFRLDDDWEGGVPK